MPTRAECEVLANLAVERYADLLGLSGEWRVRFRFASADDDAAMADSAAQVDFDPVHRIARVSFTPYLKPEFYDLEAAHETLHVLFYTIQRAVDELNEPAKSVMNDLLHARIDRLARALSGQAPIEGEERGKVPPWECSGA